MIKQKSGTIIKIKHDPDLELLWQAVRSVCTNEQLEQIMTFMYERKIEKAP
jgi:hypothetical protein